MFCGALTGRMKPKLTTYCRIMVMPRMLTPPPLTLETSVSTEMMMGIMAEARAVAEAKPMWMTMRNRARMARMVKGVLAARPKTLTMYLANQTPALVEMMADPRLMPMPNRMMVPQLMRFWASFQFMMPTLGISMMVTARMVLTAVLKGWIFCAPMAPPMPNMPQVLPSSTQNSSRQMEMIMSLNSAPFMGPSSSSSFLMMASPPGIWSISGGMSLSSTK